VVGAEAETVKTRLDQAKEVYHLCWLRENRKPDLRTVVLGNVEKW
jgi:hypothetical protein